MAYLDTGGCANISSKLKRFEPVLESCQQNNRRSLQNSSHHTYACNYGPFHSGSMPSANRSARSRLREFWIIPVMYTHVIIQEYTF